MKKILVTGPFEGAVELMYGEEGVGGGPGEPMTAENMQAPLLAVDFGQAVIPDRRKLYLMRCIPVRFGPWKNEAGEVFGFEDAFPNGVKILVEDKELDFEKDFWMPYGKKMHKERAVKEWGRLTKAERALACVRVHAYLRFLSRSGGIGKADADNWLKKKYFNNDYDNL